ncbi:GIY-YIG nuclease family protein [Rhizobiaceae bacterium CRRU44]|uniref:GIY-YIG nuclease family protein n=1 Tax=Ferranicluibacter rubi TaxID=2715133 RepID=A0AA43ZDR0_9HYPH|nr:GIY-YIG nuclease family protein [Ferranicluibacter rubi]NHT75883.1 GIY-YIG nuclease family protein [Ferranicluibacter rubi]NHT75943.1 GIY-YIG nuclease family protein [Ferranicluibacter rubi]
MTDESSMGLKWRFRKDGTRVAYWVCSGRKLHENFKPRTARLWSGNAPSVDDLESIRSQCQRLQADMHELAMSPRRNRRTENRSGSIYFIQSRRMVKIGFTAGKADQRLRKLQIGSGEPLLLLGSVEGDQIVEKQLHWRFKNHHSHGEWFFIAGSLRTYINKLFGKSGAVEQAQNNF